MQNILITGITGQDGIFLVDRLMKSYSDINILGVSRNRDQENFSKKLSTLNKYNLKNLNLKNINLLDLKEVEENILKFKPDKIFNLSGPSSVYESILYPEKTMNEICKIFENITQTLISNDLFVPFFQASSSEMFGQNAKECLNETIQFNPNSPYAKAKLINHDKVIDYSTKYNWNIYSGIMFNHESEFRNHKYLFMKVINSANLIKNKKVKKLTIGSLDYKRDWSFAADVVEGIIRIMEKGKNSCYVIGSGVSYSIENLVETVFEYYGLDWKKYVDVDEKLLRQGDPKEVCSDPKILKDEFGWKCNYSFYDLIDRCIKKNYYKSE